MIRRATQRPTGKTAAPRHPFFIGSRPEPVFSRRNFLPCFGVLRSVGSLYCVRRDDSAHWSRDLTLRCWLWLCPCLLRSTLVLAEP
uniref:Uncharacterized protein n=3 Tax=Canis lupus TaxID=9612 RepID=A0A8C0SVK2_CANLF